MLTKILRENIPGDKIENVRISPAKLFLRDNVAKRVVVTIPVSDLSLDHYGFA